MQNLKYRLIKRTTLAISLCFFSLTVVNAQDENWSAEVYYPISVGASFGSSNQGIVGVGLKYRFKELGEFTLGASLDATWFATTITNDTDPIQELDYRDFFLQPRLYVERPLTADNKLRALAGLGWSFSRTLGQTFVNGEGIVEGTDFNSGPNLNLGLTYGFAARWFVHGQYDLILSFGDLPNRSIGLLKLGVGFRF
jgi:hypothetical protein